MKRKVIGNYTLCDILGEGSYGTVYHSIHQKNNEQYAIKVIPVKKFKENSKLEEFSTNEIKNLTRIEPNPYIIKFVEMLKTANNFYFVYEFCNGKTLEAKLKEEFKLSEKQALRIFCQLLDAFKVLNKYNIMHRDLKPENIFFHNGNAKLGDFGFCKTLLKQGDMTSTMLGSPIYMAPQVLRGEIYTSKADIWSLGVVFYQMLFGVCPFQSRSIAQLIISLDNSEIRFPTQIDPISPFTKNLIQRMLTKDQFKRIDWFQLLTMDIEGQNKYVESSKVLSQTSHTSIFQLQKKIEELQKYSSCPSKQSRTPLQSLQPVTNYPEMPIIKNIHIDQNQGKRFQKTNSIRVDQNSDRSFKSTSGSSENIQSKQKTQLGLQNIKNIRRRFSLPIRGSRRKQLLNEHNSCLMAVRTAINFTKSGESNCLVFSYLIFKKVWLILSRMRDSISECQFQVSDILFSVRQQVELIYKYIQEIECQLRRVGISVCGLWNVGSVLKERYSQQCNKRLWYEMIVFLSEERMKDGCLESEWENKINKLIV